MAWNLRIHDSKTLEEGGGDLWPQLTIGAPNYNQPFGCNAEFPSHRWTEPPPDVEHRHRFGCCGGGQQRDSKRGESATWRPHQPQYPSRLNNEIDDGATRLRRA